MAIIILQSAFLFEVSLFWQFQKIKIPDKGYDAIIIIGNMVSSKDKHFVWRNLVAENKGNTSRNIMQDSYPFYQCITIKMSNKDSTSE